MTTVEAAAIATRVVALARAGHFEAIEALFAPPLRAVASAETVRVGWATEISKTGPVAVVGEPVCELTQAGKTGLIRVSVPLTCAQGQLTVAMSVDDAGLLQGLRISSAVPTAWTPPSYAHPRRFAEHDVTVGSGPLAVPGTLSLPHGPGPHSGVVLLGGGGPVDRDETSGPNKPLKDLAWGLASRGVAVVRFDKVTYAHTRQVANTPTFTMTDEYVPHAVAALQVLRHQPTVDHARLFLLGHSMGGRVAPRIATAEPSVAGLVLLAGDAQPMQHAAIRVARYLAALQPDPALETAVAVLERQAALLESPELSPSTPASGLPFGFSGAYWLDLRAYDPVAAAAALDKPMLILQGGRDYQVTVEDDLARWQAGIGHRPNVTTHVYPADDHLFFPGSGPSTPAEYASPHHVDPAVVADIAAWLGPQRGKLARFLSVLKDRTR